jgi:hypothetical protein
VKEFVGVMSGIGVLTEERLLNLEKKDNSAFLKREALMFSRVAIYDLKEMLPRLNMIEGDPPGGTANVIERLIHEGIVFEPRALPVGGQVKNTEFGILNKIRELLDEESRAALQSLIAERLDERLECDPSFFGEAMKRLISTFPPLMFYSEYEARCASISLRELDNMNAYPLLTRPLPSLLNLPSFKNEVVTITLNLLPVPDESVPWEQIIEYRSDPDSQSKFLALRHWMSEVARAELTPAEVEEKLEHLIDQYRQHMKLHRMKTNIGTLETIVTTSAEVLGDLASFKWGKAAEALFSLKRRQVALLEGELTAPGSEVAYIVKARETFP